jgi:hypothetical protein
MNEIDPPVLIFGGIIVAVILIIVGYFIVRAMKGSLKLELSQKSLVSGDKILGTLSVVTKKAIQVDRLYVALVGEREVRERRRNSSGDSTTSHEWIEFYRDEADIIMDEPMSAGFTETYGFELDTPSEGHAMTGGQALSKFGDSMKDGVGKSLVQGLGALGSMTNMSGRKRWKVKARLEMKGVDLADSSKIHVSLKQT